MANVRSRLKDSKAGKSQGRGRIAKRETKRKKTTPKKLAKSKETKAETKLQFVAKKNQKPIAKQKPEKITLRAIPTENKDKEVTKKTDVGNVIEVPNGKRATKGRGAARSGEVANSKVAKNKEHTNNKNSKSCNKLKENYNILTKELTKKIPCNPDKPQIVTINQKTSPANASESSSGFGISAKRSEKRKKCKPLPHSPLFPVASLESGRPSADCAAVEEGGKMWTAPKPTSPPADPYVLPVCVEENKVRKIEDMSILREMLKLHKIRLSNGVQISVPQTTHQPYECDYCGKTFRAKQDLRKHIFIHLDIRPYPCPLCESRFRQRGNLKTHMTRKHAEDLPSPETFICHHCGARFFVKEAIRAHVRKHFHKLEKRVRTYGCPHCNKRFARNSLLRAHLRGYHSASRLFCFLCSASYRKRASLNTHIRRHLGIHDLNLICHICGKGFAHLDSIKTHILSLHQDVKRFQCPVCSKWLKGHLREHMRTHVHSKPYACLDCGKRFAQTSQLAVHKRSHTGVKPYVCRVCKRPFSHSNALLLHIRIHTGEKPFECAMCPLAFSQLPHMKAHMFSIHNKKEVYKCDDCGQFFKLRVTLEAHRQECPQRDPDEMPWPDEPGAGEPAMNISKMRFLLAVLLRSIADENRLKVLALMIVSRQATTLGGWRRARVKCVLQNAISFNKRLIDDLLVDSLEATGHSPCKDPAVPPAERLRDNIQLLLNWTVPQDIMSRYRKQKKTTEQLLEELTG